MPANLIAPQTRSRRFDGGKRRAQFVGDGRQDRGFQPVAFFEDSCPRLRLCKTRPFERQCALAGERLQQTPLARRQGWFRLPKPNLPESAARHLDGKNPLRRALRGSVIRLVLAEVALLIVAGMAAGIGAGLLGGQYVESQLFGVKARDPLVFGLSALLLFWASLAAGWIPAWRAARIDPIRALRYE
ncbi:MAG: hypothetical protein DPW18_18730 [Chloroflexi bacterium]|nr:hypothetical protein [Chloroflexota bacterium]